MPGFWLPNYPTLETYWIKNKVIGTDDMSVFEVIPVKKKKKRSIQFSKQRWGRQPHLLEALKVLSTHQSSGKLAAAPGLDLWPLPAPSGPRDGDQESPRTGSLFPESLVPLAGGSWMLIA